MNVAELQLRDGLELAGGRARIEVMTQAHAPGMLEALDDVSLWRYLPTPPPVTIELMEEHVAGALKAAAASGTMLPFVVIDRSTGRCCGSTRYLDIQPANDGIEIGWTWYSRRVQRTSINTECKLLLMTHAFERLGCIRMQLKCDWRNEPSKAAIQRIGAKYEGTLRHNMKLYDGHVRDTSHFSILREEWAGVKARLEARLRAG